MANFYNDTFSKHDDWMTPKNAWHDINDYIPKDKVIWEAFYGDGRSGQFLTELGCNVIHEDIDFFNENRGDIVISNPPFTKIPQVLQRLILLNKPFILIMPSSKINTQCFRSIFKDIEKPQLIIPKKRINFQKMVNGEMIKHKYQCNFDCFYYCWKMKLPSDITWL